MQDFEEGNIERFQATARRALDGPDRVPVERGNLDPGNRDVITALRSGERNHRRCRLLEFRSELARGPESTLRFPVCRQPDDSWKAE
ncbi:MAG TPA: hypothetical protein VFY81_12625 [Gammaproteobacteria bacterium]|nr:hypothetical protein [Gammaproteobacteria bacterium]